MLSPVLHNQIISQLRAFCDFLDNEYEALVEKDIAKVLSYAETKNAFTHMAHQALAEVAHSQNLPRNPDALLVQAFAEVREKIARNQHKYKALLLYTKLRKRIFADLLNISFGPATYNANGLEPSQVIIHEPSLRFGQNA